MKVARLTVRNPVGQRPVAFGRRAAPDRELLAPAGEVDETGRGIEGHAAAVGG